MIQSPSYHKQKPYLKYEQMKAEKISQNRINLAQLKDFTQKSNNNLILSKQLLSSEKFSPKKKMPLYLHNNSIFSSKYFQRKDYKQFLNRFTQENNKSFLLHSKLAYLKSFSPESRFSNKLPELNQNNSAFKDRSGSETKIKKLLGFNIESIFSKYFKKIPSKSYLKEKAQSRDISPIINQETQTDEFLNEQLFLYKPEIMNKCQLKPKNLDLFDNKSSISITPKAEPNTYQRKFFRISSVPKKRIILWDKSLLSIGK